MTPDEKALVNELLNDPWLSPDNRLEICNTNARFSDKLALPNKILARVHRIAIATRRPGRRVVIEPLNLESEL